MTVSPPQSSQFSSHVVQHWDPPGTGLPEAAVLDHGRGGADVGRGAAGRTQVALIQEPQQLFLSRAAHVLGKHTHHD